MPESSASTTLLIFLFNTVVRMLYDLIDLIGEMTPEQRDSIRAQCSKMVENIDEYEDNHPPGEEPDEVPEFMVRRIGTVPPQDTGSDTPLFMTERQGTDTNSTVSLNSFGLQSVTAPVVDDSDYRLLDESEMPKEKPVVSKCFTPSTLYRP